MATYEKMVSTNCDIDYPKALAKAVWRERNTYIIDLLVSNSFIRPDEDPFERKKIVSTKICQPIMLKLGSAVAKTPESKRLAIRRMVLKHASQQYVVGLASELIVRDIIVCGEESFTALEWAILSYYVCARCGFPQLVDRLPDNFFEEYSEKNEQELKDFLGGTVFFFRIVSVLLCLRDEHYPIYKSLYTDLADRMALRESDESFESLDKALIHFLMKRKHFQAEVRKCFALCQRFAQEEAIHSLLSCANKTVREILCYVTEKFTQILEELRAWYEPRLPLSSDPETLLALILAIEPPLEEYDRKSAEAEVDALRLGTLARRDSPLFTSIFPILRKEKDAQSPEEFSEMMRKRYSYYFVQNLAQGVYALPQALQAKGVKKRAEDKGKTTKQEEEKGESTGQATEENKQEKKREGKGQAKKEDKREEKGENKQKKKREEKEAAKRKAKEESKEEPKGEERVQETREEKRQDTGENKQQKREDREEAKDEAPRESAGQDQGKDTEENKGEAKEEDTGQVKKKLALESRQAAQRALPFESTPASLRSSETGPLWEKLVRKEAENGKRGCDGRSSLEVSDQADERAGGRAESTVCEEGAEKGVDKGVGTEVEEVVDKGVQDCGKKDLSANARPLDLKLPTEAIQASYLSLVYSGDTCALYWLTRVAGSRAPSPLWLCELLHLGLHLLPDSLCTARIAELCSEAIIRIEDLDTRQCLLLAAALLRPSLMMPDLNMATLVGSLASRLSEYACTPFLRRLTQFIVRGNAVEAQVFVGRDAEKHRRMLYESLRAASLAFLERVQNGKMPDVAARKIRLELFSEKGILGSVFERCIERDFSGLSECINEYAFDPEKIIHNCRTYPKTKKIVEYPRKKLLESIAEAFALLKKWQDFSLAENTLGDGEQSYAVASLRELFSTIEADIGKLSEFPEGRLFLQTWIELSECPNRALPAEPRDLRALIDLWPLRLPFLLRTSPKTLDMFIAWQSDESRREKNAVAETLALHMVRGELDACEKFLSVFSEYETCLLDLAKLADFAPRFQGREPPTLREFFVYCQKDFSVRFSETFDAVRGLVSEYGFRSVLHFSQQSQYNSRLEDIWARYGKSRNDKATGVRELKKIERELMQCDAERKAEVRSRIDELLGQKDISKEARERLETVCSEHLRLGMYNSAWADIVDVEEHLISGKALRSVTGPPASEATAAHDFYDLLRNDAFPSEIVEPVWSEAKRFLRNKPLSSPKEVAIVTRLLRWLGFTLDQTEQAKSVYNTGSPNFWRVIQFTMEIAGPIPQWGSCQNRHLIALGWDVQPEDINQLLISSHFESSDAVTILCFTAFNWLDRKKLLGFCASLRMAPLIVDTNLMNFLTKQKQEVRTDVLFRVALAGSPINPYMPNMAGSVPREIFFGREEDIRAVTAPEGPCIIYGGRQLGKSALLQQIARRPNPGVNVLLHSMTPSESSLLEVALAECRKAGIVDVSTQLDTFAQGVLAWLAEHLDMRILLLLDECDKALEADARRDFLDAARFRNLMQETNRRFKVVFTGLHSVQRFSQIPNNPLYHFGEPLCIGPLSPEAANDLMRKPTAILGLEFANDQLVQMALNHCNYQPKLIQIFCSELVRALNDRTDREPFHTIDKETILKIYESHDLKKKILECFEMTLNLDERYLVIGYAMAINHGRGFSLNQLLDELRYFWPAAFEKNSEICDIHNVLRSLLHEMEGLGLVISLGGQYRLRTPNIVELLGGEDSIYMRLDPYQTKEYRPSGNPDERRQPGFEPFVASQHNRLIERGSSLYWVSGSDALGLSSVPGALERIASEIKARIIHLQGASVAEVSAKMRAEYEKREKGSLIFWISSRDIAATGAFIEAADAWLVGLSNAKKVVKIVCLLHPNCLYECIRTGLAERFSSYQLELEPWTSEGLEFWCKEKGVPGIDSLKTIEETGGWAYLIERVLRSEHLPVCDFLESDFCLPDDSEVKDLVVRFGREVSSEAFSRDDVWQWLGESEAFQSDEKKTQLLDTLISLKVLRTSGQQVWLDRYLARALKGEGNS